MNHSIVHVLRYFQTFTYPPTLDEIHMFLSDKVDIQILRRELIVLEKSNLLYTEGGRYTLEQDTFKIFTDRSEIARDMYLQAERFSSIFGWIPSILFIGISGSLSMENTKHGSDIDFFIVTKEHSVWISRFIIRIMTYLLRLFQVDAADKLCFNLFFTEYSLELPRKKRNEYTAHELLQLKPLIDKNNIYEKMLAKNTWVYDLFPNVQTSFDKKLGDHRTSKKSILIPIVEKSAKHVQVWWLSRKHYKYNEYGSQVWFIQDDFQKKFPFELKSIKKR